MTGARVMTSARPVRSAVSPASSSRNQETSLASTRPGLITAELAGGKSVKVKLLQNFCPEFLEKSFNYFQKMASLRKIWYHFCKKEHFQSCFFLNLMNVEILYDRMNATSKDALLLKITGYSCLQINWLGSKQKYIYL